MLEGYGFRADQRVYDRQTRASGTITQITDAQLTVQLRSGTLLHIRPPTSAVQRLVPLDPADPTF